MIGTVLAARYSDRFPIGIVLVATITTFALMVLLLPLSTMPAPTLLLLGLLAISGYLSNPMLVALAIRYAGAAPNLATAISTSAFNLGVTVTTAIAAAALAGVGPIGPVIVGASTFGLLFIPLSILLILRTARQRSTTPNPSDRQANRPPRSTSTITTTDDPRCRAKPSTKGLVVGAAQDAGVGEGRGTVLASPLQHRS